MPPLGGTGSGWQGTQGPQMGTGSEAAAAWWLATPLVLADDSETAVAPMSTMQIAKVRTTSLIIGNPFLIGDGGELPPKLTIRLAQYLQ